MCHHTLQSFLPLPSSTPHPLLVSFTPQTVLPALLPHLPWCFLLALILPFLPLSSLSLLSLSLPCLHMHYININLNQIPRMRMFSICLSLLWKMTATSHVGMVFQTLPGLLQLFLSFLWFWKSRGLIWTLLPSPPNVYWHTHPKAMVSRERQPLGAEQVLSLCEEDKCFYRRDPGSLIVSVPFRVTARNSHLWIRSSPQ